MLEARILVVDDEASVREIISVLLERNGYATVMVDCGEAALQVLRNDAAFDLVLSDVMMPGMDGLGLLDQICADYPGTPVVVITAVHDIHVATNAFRRGAIDYLLKPFELTQLLSAVGRGLEHRRMRIQNMTYRENLEEIVLTRTGRLRATMQDLERSYDFTLEALGDALDLRDAETEGHSRRVTAYAIQLASAMGLGAKELRVIARGAFLHDIGKISTPDYVLLKPGHLDADETTIMREHCERGYEMVRKIPFLKEASEIVYAHQESFDGRGYPRGLQAHAIPLGARIFAIADTLDAITSNRPYREAASFEQAREEIRKCSGRQFDPAIVRVFLEIDVARWEELREMAGQLASSGISAALRRHGVDVEFANACQV